MAGKNSLTAARLREILNYDPDTGVFTWVNSKNGYHEAGGVAGVPNAEGRVFIRVGRFVYAAGQLAWLYFYGAWPSGQIDHRDETPRHNWIKNLRPATQLQNLQNRSRANANNTTGELGVSWNRSKRKFVASIAVDKDRLYLGGFDAKADARAAYLAKKAEVHPFWAGAPP